MMSNLIARVKIVVGALIVVLGASLFLQGTAGTALAEGALVVKGEGCGVFNSDGTGVFDVDADIFHVTTPSGNNLIVCKGVVDPPADGQTIIFRSGCTSFDEVTTHGKQVIRPDGSYTLTCHFNPSGQG